MKPNNNNTPIGYKQTKLGIIPEEWELEKLNSLGNFSKGKGITKAQLVETGLPAIRYGELYTHHHIYIKGFKSYINQETADNSNQIKQNDILFAGSGETLKEIGKCATYLGNEMVYAGGDIIILTPHSNIDSLYLSYSLNSDIVLRQRRKLGQGHSVVHIYSSGLKTLPIPLPPLPEQKAIAQILTTWDKAISKQQLLIEKYKLKKKGLMQKLLAPKEDWKEVRLGDLGDFFSGGTPISTNKEYYSGNIPFIGSGDISKKEVNSFITEKALNSSSAKIVNKGDILYALYGATSGEVALSQIQGAINQAVLCIRIDENKSFIKELLRLNKDHIVAKYLQGGQGNLSAKIIKNLKFKIPSYETQTKIANILSSADKEIEILEKQLDKLKEQKKGLMQVLLSGKIRVKIENN